MMPNERDAGMDLVLSTLNSTRHGISIADISRKCGMNRNSVAKYLNILVTLGQAEMQVVGPARVYHLSSRVPFSDEFLRCYPDPAIMLDEEAVVKMVNMLFLEQYDVCEEDILGKSIGEVPVPVVKALASVPELRTALNGEPPVMSRWMKFSCADAVWKYWIVSAVSGDGSFGVFVSIRLMQD